MFLIPSLCLCALLFPYCSFVINLGNSDDYLALHMSFRFDAHGDTRTVVCNSYHGGMWFEEHKEAQFPFNQGEKFKVRNYILCVCVYVCAQRWMCVFAFNLTHADVNVLSSHVCNGVLPGTSGGNNLQSLHPKYLSTSLDKNV